MFLLFTLLLCLEHNRPTYSLDSDEKIKETEVGYIVNEIHNNSKLLTSGLCVDFATRIRFHRCRKWIGRIGSGFQAIRNQKLDCVATGSRRCREFGFRGARTRQVSSEDERGLAISNRTTTWPVSGAQGSQVTHQRGNILLSENHRRKIAFLWSLQVQLASR